MSIEELQNIIKWIKQKTKYIIIVTPFVNTCNIINFYTDITHTRPYSFKHFLKYLEQKYLRTIQ